MLLILLQSLIIYINLTYGQEGEPFRGNGNVDYCVQASHFQLDVSKCQQACREMMGESYTRYEIRGLYFTNCFCCGTKSQSEEYDDYPPDYKADGEVEGSDDTMPKPEPETGPTGDGYRDKSDLKYPMQSRSFAMSSLYNGRPGMMMVSNSNNGAHGFLISGNSFRRMSPQEVHRHQQQMYQHQRQMKRNQMRLHNNMMGNHFRIMDSQNRMQQNMFNNHQNIMSNHHNNIMNMQNNIRNYMPNNFRRHMFGLWSRSAKGLRNKQKNQEQEDIAMQPELNRKRNKEISEAKRNGENWTPDDKPRLAKMPTEDEIIGNTGHNERTSGNQIPEYDYYDRISDELPPEDAMVEPYKKK